MFQEQYNEAQIRNSYTRIAPVRDDPEWSGHMVWVDVRYASDV